MCVLSLKEIGATCRGVGVGYIWIDRGRWLGMVGDVGFLLPLPFLDGRQADLVTFFKGQSWSL